MTAGRDRWLWPLAAVGGLLFFASLGRLWPLADTDLTVPRATLDRRATEVLARRALLPSGRALGDYVRASQLDVDEAALDYAERALGRDRAQALVRQGVPLVTYDVLLKRAGDPDGLAATFDGVGRTIGWSRGVQDDAPGAALPVDSGRVLVQRALSLDLGLSLGDGTPAQWHETGAASRVRPRRTDHTFTYERLLSARPELRERAVATVSGDLVTGARRYLVVPAAGERAARARAAPVRALQTVGFALLAAGALGALAVFLLRLRAGTARLARAAYWSAIVFACAFLTNAFAAYDLLAHWDPLWPRWIATLVRLGDLAAGLTWMFVVLFALIAAGDALDREAGAGRGDTLWRLGRGGVADPAVGLASVRGFAIGLVCGAVLTAAVLAVTALGGGFTALQPRGFFFYALNSSAPSVATLLFFANIALLEELGYRFFAGPWLLAATRRRWVAIVLPAAVYGLTHTGLDFLPPAEPFWGRAVVMTAVGCVWGWALLRYDALTVVTSHLTSDLFIFNWPRLASAHLDVRLAALATVAAPLVPALVAGVAAVVGGARERRFRVPQEVE
ncbi:Abortive infection protein [Gemmatirosa kalamazoonensis]|uniref:Abortive infection protein n=1 Tax=Gemmatirosa kalamazoonensis TaxID=861299 RepID=W0RMG2_9BACT|nr:CPBP family intramembrane glutamic endopeptidase [Gemmatirosa kalamazoonensis]AHG91961.1 Abortive infection protein [Gemmatirosa kalamazoonensis]